MIVGMLSGIMRTMRIHLTDQEMVPLPGSSALIYTLSSARD
jgi:hypothetical protein